jgi:hypothetical protein
MSEICKPDSQESIMGDINATYNTHGKDLMIANLSYTKVSISDTIMYDLL